MLDRLFVPFRHSFILSHDHKDVQFNLNKILLIMAYLKLNSNSKNQLGTSIDMIVKSIGYSPNTRPNRINDIIKNQLRWLESHNYIFILDGISIFELNSKECFIIVIISENDVFDMRKKDEDGYSILNDKNSYQYDKFVMLEDYEFEAISTLNSRIGKIDYSDKDNENKINTDRAILLRVFLNIKKHINMNDLTPKVCFATHKTLCRDCNVTTTGTINNAIWDLVKLEILSVFETGSYIDSAGKRQNMVNYYAIDKDELDQKYCIASAKQWLKENKGIIVHKFAPIMKPNKI